MTMKKLTSLLLFLFVSATVFAQSRIDGREIIAKINRGEAVSYRNATISGNLDFTQLDNRKVEESKSGSWWNGGDTHRSYRSIVTVPVRFENCTFTGDVLAYYSLEDENETYNASFKEAASFENCAFERKSAFKYSHFEEGAVFSGCKFEDEALFKYAKFSEGPAFVNARFEGEANFKYVKFPEGTDFSRAVFSQDADFKYAAFPDGANFERTTFEQLANFKYTSFSEPLQLSGIQFRGSEDFKYTNVGGKDFSSYLLENK